MNFDNLFLMFLHVIIRSRFPDSLKLVKECDLYDRNISSQFCVGDKFLLSVLILTWIKNFFISVYCWRMTAEKRIPIRPFRDWFEKENFRFGVMYIEITQQISVRQATDSHLTAE